MLEEVSGNCVCAHADINTFVKLNLVIQESGSNELLNEAVGSQRKELWGLGFFIYFFKF